MITQSQIKRYIKKWSLEGKLDTERILEIENAFSLSTQIEFEFEDTILDLNNKIEDFFRDEIHILLPISKLEVEFFSEYIFDRETKNLSKAEKQFHLDEE